MTHCRFGKNGALIVRPDGVGQGGRVKIKRRTDSLRIRSFFVLLRACHTVNTDSIITKRARPIGRIARN